MNKVLDCMGMACPIPVISAVGHESDFTICDFVADRRAPTPSAAAELAVPDGAELLAQIRGLGARMSAVTLQRISQEKRYVAQIAGAAVFQRPERILDLPRMRLGDRAERLERAMARQTEQRRISLQKSGARLEALSPLAVLTRGYAAVSREDVTLTRAQDVRNGDRLTIRFADGAVDAVAEKGANRNG